MSLEGEEVTRMRRKIRLISAFLLGLAGLLAVAPASTLADVQQAIITVKGALQCVF
jgi:hypothetical protein